MHAESSERGYVGCMGNKIIRVHKEMHQTCERGVALCHLKSRYLKYDSYLKMAEE